jgi:hypothetical protein
MNAKLHTLLAELRCRLETLYYDEVISCVFISEVEFAHKRSPLLLNLRREGIAI